MTRLFRSFLRSDYEKDWELHLETMKEIMVFSVYRTAQITCNGAPYAEDTKNL